ncbi:MAG: chorismate mutase [Firmicutes bacterium]|nr:chorismate mutase [Bacillota bacterium]
MSDLNDYREQINRIDDEMAELFEKRMRICGKIGEYKKEHFIPVKDEARESQLIEKNSQRIADPGIKPYYVDYIKSVMNISCNYQNRLISGIRAAYSGVPGAYAYVATNRFFDDCIPVACPNFDQAFSAVETGDCDCAVLPLENSYAGEVGAVTDMLFSGNLYVNRVITLDIEHNLLGLKGATRKDIKTVVSHPQALAQCDEFIKQNGFATVEYANTARAAGYVKELGDKTVAAIASEETAEIFGLDVIERRIYSERNNSTRFGLFSKVLNLPDENAKADSCGFILMFTVPDATGALAMALDIIGSHGFNMRSLRSRPMKGLSWNYYFYVEGEGNIASPDGQDLLQELTAVCGRLKLAGAYNY